MSDTKGNASDKKQSVSTIDPIYEKFTKSVVRALASTEFYEYFMDALSKSNNRFQFSNRRLEKLVDLAWVDAIDEALEGFQNIIANPRNRIQEDELIVNVAHARKAGADVVRHLAQHSSLVEDFQEDTGDVRPSKLMQKYREDSTEMYENRLVFTVLEHAYHFVRIRHEALFEAMNEEYGAKLKVLSEMESATETVRFDTYLKIKKKDSALETDEKNAEVFARIDRINRLLTSFMASPFAEQLKKVNRVKGAVNKTNVLKKNPDYKKIVKLWEFLRGYEDVGYMIKVTEQNPHIDEKFQQDIYHNIMFQYIILKGYLEDESEREIPVLKEKKRKIKPKVIKSIIEELTEDYDIPDVEIRKVLIEELTKEQLMQEEASERLRLVEEAEARRKAEEEQKAKEKQEEKERIRREEKAEAERLRMERKAEEKKKLQERMERELEDRRRTGLFKKEIEWFEAHKNERLMARQDEWDKLHQEKMQDFESEAKKQEEADALKKEKRERAIQKRKEAEERAVRREEERQEKLRQEQLAAQFAADMKIVGIYLDEANYFFSVLDTRKQERIRLAEEERIERENLLRERQLKQEQKQTVNGKPNKRRFGIR